MNKTDIYERLKSCLFKGGLDADKDNLITKAELKGYSAGIEMVRNILNLSHRGAIHNFIYPTEDVMENEFANCDYLVSSNTVYFQDYVPETIGALCDNWFGVWHHIVLEDNEDFYSKLSGGEYTWSQLDGFKMRWEMLDSL